MYLLGSGAHLSQLVSFISSVGIFLETLGSLMQLIKMQILTIQCQNTMLISRDLSFISAVKDRYYMDGVLRFSSIG